MPVFRLTTYLHFPDPSLADPDGLLAIGGDLSVARLRLAYRMGLFPWFNRGEPILWWCPDPRTVLRTEALHVPRSLAKIARRGDYTVTWNRAFADVIAACATTPRPGQRGTWITPAVQRAFLNLHEAGDAVSVEAWKGEQLVGGLYGVLIGRMFFGESMFAHAPDASKVAFVQAVSDLREIGVALIDCQMRTPHLVRFGAEDWPRERFLAAVGVAVDQERTGPLPRSAP